MALVKRDWWSGKYEVVSDQLSQADIYAVVRGVRTENVPEYEMVVVEDVADEDLRRLVNAYFLEATTLEDWNQLNDANPEGPTFRRFSEGWGIRLWSREEHGYRHVKHPLMRPLERLYEQSRSRTDPDPRRGGRGARCWGGPYGEG